jgi:hypothetical protein
LIASSIGNSKQRSLGKKAMSKGANGLSHPRDTCVPPAKISCLVGVTICVRQVYGNHTDEALRKLVSD